MNFQRVFALLSKEFSQLFKDKRLLPLVFVAPVIQLVILGFAASFDVRNISVVLCDLDKTTASRKIIEKFTTSSYFTIEAQTENYSEIENYLNSNKATVGIVIPKNFEKKKLRNESAKIQILLDGSEGNSSLIAVGYANQIIANENKKILLEKISNVKFSEIKPQTQVFYNPEMKSRNFMLPAILVMVLFITTMNLTAMAIVKEKEIGTLEQILVSPINSIELIFGKLIPFAIIGIIDVIVVLLVMVFGFGIEIKGNLLLLFLYTGFFILTSSGLGLFISTVSRTQQQAMMTNIFFVLQPMLYLSGFTFPIENMPQVLQWISFLIPVKYYLTVIRSIVLKGVSISSLYFEGIALLVLGIVIISFSILRFRKKME